MCGALHLLWNVNLQIPFIPIQLFIKYSIALFIKMFQISQNVVLIIILKISSDKPTFFFFLTNTSYSTPKSQYWNSIFSFFVLMI